MSTGHPDSTRHDADFEGGTAIVPDDAPTPDPQKIVDDEGAENSASAKSTNWSRAGTIVLYFVFLVPWCFGSTVLLVLATVEWLVRSCMLSQKSTFESLVLVKAIGYCKAYVKLRTHGITGRDPSDCVTDVLFPSLSHDQAQSQKRYVDDGKLKEIEIREEIKDCKELIAQSRGQRIRNLKPKQQQPPSDAQERLQRYHEDITGSRRLREHLAILEQDLRQVRALALTQATADRTGFHGLSDWAERVTSDHQDLMTALCSISLVGAGLTYTTVFSASRGNLGLMCYAWALFNCGFIIPMASLSLLSWASRRSRATLFASPKIWSLLLNFFIYISVIAVAAALVLLNVSIIDLHVNWSGGGVLQFDVNPIPAGAFALVCAVVTGIMTVLAFVLHYLVNGWSNLIAALQGRPTDREVEVPKYDDYLLR